MNQDPKPPRLMRLPAVLDRTGIKKALVYKLVKLGEFPKPIHVTPRCTVWVEADVDQWINERIERREAA